jgi:hypothetical protein
MSDLYKDALHAAQADLAKLDERRSVLLRLIANLRQLSEDDAYELTPPPGYIPKGLTEEIKTILGLTALHLDAMQIRDNLIQRGFKHSNPKNLLISVHTVLGRIKDELDVVEREGKPAYRVRGVLRLGDLVNPDPNAFKNIIENYARISSTQDEKNPVRKTKKYHKH